MKVDYSLRSSGRTTRMLETLIKNENAKLLTFSVKECERLKKAVYILDNDKHQSVVSRIYYWEDYVRENIGRYEPRQYIMVDNADYILERVIGKFIDEISITKDEIRL
jgi:hypothetical protein